MRPFFLRFGRLHGDLCGFRKTVTIPRLENVSREKQERHCFGGAFFMAKKFGACLDARREAPCFMGMNSRFKTIMMNCKQICNTSRKKEDIMNSLSFSGHIINIIVDFFFARCYNYITKREHRNINNNPLFGR